MSTTVANLQYSNQTTDMPVTHVYTALQDGFYRLTAIFNLQNTSDPNTSIALFLAEDESVVLASGMVPQPAWPQAPAQTTTLYLAAGTSIDVLTVSPNGPLWGAFNLYIAVEQI